jgi:hypothetical protein
MMMRTYFFPSTRRRFLSIFVLGLVLAAGSSALAQQFNPEFFKVSSLAQHWAVSWRPDARSCRRAFATERFLHGPGERWRLEDRGLRAYLDAYLRRPTNRVRGLYRGGAIRPERDLRRAAAKDCNVPICRLATAYTNQLMRERPGRIWDCATASRFPQIAVDPRDANRILVAVAGHPYGPNEERGIFRSTDGGKTFEKVLYKDENVGGADVLFDPRNPDIAYSSLWEARQGPWENGAWNGAGGGIYKSNDNGKTWQQLSGGLPAGIVQSNLAIAPSNTNRLIASVAVTGAVNLYRSDDAGSTWAIITKDPRPAGRIGGGDLCVPSF